MKRKLGAAGSREDRPGPAKRRRTGIDLAGGDKNDDDDQEEAERRRTAPESPALAKGSSNPPTDVDEPS